MLLTEDLYRSTIEILQELETITEEEITIISDYTATQCNSNSYEGSEL